MVQQASAGVWHWSEVKPANGQCSSIMRLRRPLSGARGGELPLRPRLPSDIGCPGAQRRERERKKKNSPDPLEGRESLTPTGRSQVAVSGGKRTSGSEQITASLLAAARGEKGSGGAAVCFDMMMPLVQCRHNNSGVCMHCYRVFMVLKLTDCIYCIRALWQKKTQIKS